MKCKGLSLKIKLSTIFRKHKDKDTKIGKERSFYFSIFTPHIGRQTGRQCLPSTACNIFLSLSQNFYA